MSPPEVTMDGAVPETSNAELLKQARRALGLTQTELGALFGGRTKRTVIRWERGTTPVPAEVMAELARRVEGVDAALPARTGADAPPAHSEPSRGPLPVEEHGASLSPGAETSVVAAAAQKLRVAPASARAALHAALVAAEAAGATLRSLRLALEHADPVLGFD